MLRNYFHFWFSKPVMQKYLLSFSLVRQITIYRVSLPATNSQLDFTIVISNGIEFDKKISRERAAWHGILPYLALQLALLASKISERVRTFHGLGFYCKNSKSICTHHTMKMEASGDFYFIFILHGREHFNSNIPPVS